MENIFVQKKVFLAVYSFLLLTGLIVVLQTDQYELHININQYHHRFWNTFFKYATYLGDGIMFPIIIIPLFFFNKKWAITFLYASVLCLISSYVFKHYVFGINPRPFEVFGNKLHLIDGITMKHWNSFPSGHTLTAFTIFTLAAVFTKKRLYQLLFLGLAVIAGISRVYISQHFLEDVLAGSFIGVSIAFVGYWLSLKFPIFK